jgi:hypothetical protein
LQTGAFYCSTLNCVKLPVLSINFLHNLLEKHYTISGTTNFWGKAEEGNVELDNKIETLRMKMLALADEVNSLFDERVVRLSQELDVLIIHRQRMMRKQGHLTAS